MAFPIFDEGNESFQKRLEERAKEQKAQGRDILPDASEVGTIPDRSDLPSNVIPFRTPNKESK